MTPSDPTRRLAEAVRAGDAAAARALLDQHPELAARLNDPLPGLDFGATALIAAVASGSRELIDLLLQAGADINQKSHWWAGGFGVLDADHDLHDFLIERGARVDAYAAARLGRMDTLRELLAADPAQVHQRGGDGQTPLHVAASVEVAGFLLEHGADMDALDVDHESTPAQYAIRERPQVARYLVARGCRSDLLLAAAMGDLALATRLLDEDPERIHTTVDATWFPMRDPRAGGHIYTWTLGAGRTAHRIALEFGHRELFALLMARSPLPLRLAVAASLGDEGLIATLLQDAPDLLDNLAPAQQRVLPDLARNEEADKVGVLLRAGWPVAARGDMGGTALHWAAWHGNAALVDELLRHAAPLELRDTEHGGTPLDWALHGSRNGWRRASGDYPGVVRALLAAGAAAPEGAVEASEPVLEILRQPRGR